MAENMPTERPFRERDYLVGRVKVPPAFYGLETRFYAYGGDSLNNLASPVTNGLILNGTTGTIQIQVDDSSYFLVEGIHILSSLFTTSQDLTTVQITDTTTSRAWSDAPIPLRDIAGKGDCPHYLSDPQLLRPTSTLNVQITNNSGSSCFYTVALVGRKIYKMKEELANLMLRRLWFQYTVNFGAILAGALGTKAQAKIYNESDFIIKRALSQSLINQAIGATAGTTSADVMMQWRDTNADRSYFNQKLNSRLLIGSYQNEILSAANAWSNSSPFQLVKPISVRRNCLFEIELDNLAASALTPFTISLEGCRIFDAA